MRANSSTGLLAVTALVVVAPHAAAQSSPGGWQFTLAPYAVAAAIDGATPSGVLNDRPAKRMHFV